MNKQGYSHESLRLLVEAQRWHEIILATDDLSESARQSPGFSFFRGMALTKTGRAAEAIPIIEGGLALSPASRWGNKLLFDAKLANGQTTEAFDTFSRFIDSAVDYEPEKAWYIQQAVELGLLDLAAEMNEKRQVIRDVPRSPRFALGVQCFCKADTLERTFASLCELKNAKTFAIVILQDNELLSSKPEHYAAECQKVTKLISDWYSRLAAVFFSIEYLANERNLGTAPTCRRLLDHIAARYAGFLFIEDDCILAPSALDWTAYHLDNSLSQAGPWFVTCESSFFDREERILTDDMRLRMERIAELKSIKDAFVFNKFVNSTCFATRSEIWKLCANARSFTRGPESLNRLVAARGMKTLAPIVPRAADIGMLHELGYSVANVGADNVGEKKNTYLLSRGQFDPNASRLFEGNTDILYMATSKLDEHAAKVVETWRLN